jgi:acrosin
MDVRLGDHADTFTVAQTIAGTTRVDAGGGDDTINVQAISGDTTIWGGAGDDTINVGDTANTLGGIGATLTVNGDLHLSEQTVNWVNGVPPTDVPATPLVVNQSGQQFTTVDAHGVKSFHPGPDGLAYVNVAKLNPDGSPMRDALLNVITQRVALPFPNKQTTIQSTAGHDTLNVVGTGDGAASLAVTADTITASSMPGTIVYAASPSTVENLNISLGAGDDTVDILSTNIATATYINSGGGNDLLRVGENGSLDGILGTLSLDAGGGLDNRLVIDDSGSRRQPSATRPAAASSAARGMRSPAPSARASRCCSAAATTPSRSRVRATTAAWSR